MEIAPGDFIYHNENGVGQVLRVFEGAAPEVEIQFKDRPPERMTRYLLERSVERISPTGFRALVFIEPETAARLIKEKPVDVICRALEDFPHSKARTEDFKEYLKPFISDWETWWENTQPLLKADPLIDTSNSKLREYALAREVRSQAEKGYHSFRFARLRGAQPYELVERARAALVLHLKDQDLPSQHKEELLDFLHQVVHLDRYELPTRLRTLFRLQEDRLIAPEEAHDWLVKLLEQDVHLNQMEPYTGRRVVEELLKSSIGEREVAILAGGMCTAELSSRLLNWATRRGDPKIIARFLLAALSENLPPALPEEKLPSLKPRLEVCLSLARSLPGNSPAWPEILTAFKQACSALENVEDFSQIPFLLPALIDLAVELDNRTLGQFAEDESKLPSILADPKYSTEFILAVLTAVFNDSKAQTLANRIENWLFATAENRQDNFWLPFLTARWENRVEQAVQVLKRIEQSRSLYLAVRGGALICDIARGAELDDLIQLIPSLDRLRLLEGDWPWKDTLEGLREKAYFTMFSEPLIHNGYRDDAVVRATQEVANRQKAVVQAEVTRKGDQLTRAHEQIRSLETLLEEKNAVLRELRGNVGGDTEVARFDERSRILRDLVTSIAEFERFSAAQTRQNMEIEAVLKRFAGLLAAYKVTATDALGAQAAFNPQKHRLVESTGVSPGTPVLVIERGFLIRDHKGRLRLLKPALVKIP